METISTGSLIYVRRAVRFRNAGIVTDPTGDVVTMAFMPTGSTPAAGDMKAASWETDSTTTPPTYIARCLVGPGGTITLTAGTWVVWVKITDNPEVPLLNAGPLQVL